MQSHLLISYTERYILYLNKNYFFQIFQKFISNLSQVHHKHQIYSNYILNPSKLNSIKNVKLKQKFDLSKKINSYFEYITTSFSKICDETISNTIIKKIFFIEDNFTYADYLKEEK